VASAEELKQVYETGQGSLKVRGTWELAETGKTTKTLYITSIPYTVNKSVLVERIADVVVSRKMPMLLDVRDVSTDDVRIELELKKEADEHKVLAYLFKHTPLQTNFAVNLTCLVPTENPEVGRPERLDLQQILWHFLHFRLEVVTRRLAHELAALLKRIHILEGFEKVFDALDAILKIIRASDGKADAAQKIMAKYELDAEQTDAILELKLYRLARLEILVIQKELKDKRKRAKEIKELLNEKEAKGKWALVRQELVAVVEKFGKNGKRRTLIESVSEEQEFTEEDLIVAEDNVVLLTADGWVKRQKEIKDPVSTRLREGDAVLACVAGSTRESLAFFSNFGTVYSCRMIDVPATTGYGEPIQKLFKLKDGEKIIALYSLDSRVIGDTAEREGKRPKVYAVAATSDGYGFAIGIAPFLEPSTRTGRRYAKVSEGVTVVGVSIVRGKEVVISATRAGRALMCTVDEVSYLSGPGKGVQLVKLDEKDDALVGVKAVKDDQDPLVLETSLGGEQRLMRSKLDLSARGGKGREAIKRGKFVKVVVETPRAPQPLSN